MARHWCFPSRSSLLRTVIFLTACSLGPAQMANAQAVKPASGSTLQAPLTPQPNTPTTFLVAPTVATSGTPSSVAAGDLNGDGRDEIVAGFRGQGFQLYIFTADDESGARWTRSVLDPGGIAAADCKIADFLGNGRPAIACSGASTANVKLYSQR